MARSIHKLSVVLVVLFFSLLVVSAATRVRFEDSTLEGRVLRCCSINGTCADMYGNFTNRYATLDPVSCYSTGGVTGRDYLSLAVSWVVPVVLILLVISGVVLYMRHKK